MLLKFIHVIHKKGGFSEVCRPAPRFLRLIGFTFLLCFTLSSIVEAKTNTPPQQILAKKKAALLQLKKKQEALALRNKNQRLVAAKRKQQQAATAKNRAQAAALKKRQQAQAATAKRKQQQAQALAAKKRQQAIAARNKPKPKTPLPQKKGPQPLPGKKPAIKKSVPVKKQQTKQTVPSAPSTPFSLLKPHTQKNAKLGGFDQLYAKNLLGQGQTVAIIEYSGVWQEMKNVINNTQGIIRPELKERYKRNFLTPIGDPKGRLHPEQKNDWIRLVSPDFHGSDVSSVVMDLAPSTKVLPVSTYNCPPPRQPSAPLLLRYGGCLNGPGSQKGCQYYQHIQWLC